MRADCQFTNSRSLFKEFSSEQALLVLAAGTARRPKDGERVVGELLRSGVNWAEVEAWARQLGVIPLLWDCLRGEGASGHVPPTVLARLREGYRLQAIRGLRIYGQLGQILAVLNRNEIPVIVLKGAYLARRIYGDVALRPMSDIDILVRQNQAGEACHLLTDHGYGVMKIGTQSRFHEEVAHIGSSHLPPLLLTHRVRVEIHTDLFVKAPVKSREMERVWDQAVPFELDGGRALALCPHHLLLYLAFHLYTHIMAGKVVLYWFSDLDQVVRRCGDGVDWDAVDAAAHALGIASRLRAVFDLLARYWGTPIPEFMRDIAPGTLPALHQLLFDARPDLRDFFPNRMRLVRNIAEKYGWARALYYVLRLLVPARAHIMDRYHPRTRKDLCRAYGIHLRDRLFRLFISLCALAKRVFCTYRPPVKR